MSKREVLQIQLQRKDKLRDYEAVEGDQIQSLSCCKIFKEPETPEDRPRSERTRTGRSNMTIKSVQQRLRRNPKRSTRQMSKDMNVNMTSIRSIIKNDLKLLPYKIRKREYVTPVQKQKSLGRAKILLKGLKACTTQCEIVFSDELLFTIEASFENQNDRE